MLEAEAVFPMNRQYNSGAPPPAHGRPGSMAGVPAGAMPGHALRRRRPGALCMLGRLGVMLGVLLPACAGAAQALWQEPGRPAALAVQLAHRVQYLPPPPALPPPPPAGLRQPVDREERGVQADVQQRNWRNLTPAQREAIRRLSQEQREALANRPAAGADRLPGARMSPAERRQLREQIRAEHERRREAYGPGRRP
jgi:hypothetical protein